MKIKLTSVYVDNQERALGFYTEVLGLTKKESQDIQSCTTCRAAGRATTRRPPAKHRAPF